MRLKMLADEVREIGVKVSDDLMFSTLIVGLYKDFGRQILKSMAEDQDCHNNRLTEMLVV